MIKKEDIRKLLDEAEAEDMVHFSSNKYLKAIAEMMFKKY